MQQVLRARGIPVIGRSKQLDSFDLAHYDLILAMDNDNFDGAISLARGEEQRAKVMRFCDYCTEHEANEVPDPYYGGDRGFEEVMDLIEDGCRNLLERLRLKIKT
jgi:protein-tyrosine phosphatase